MLNYTTFVYDVLLLKVGVKSIFSCRTESAAALGTTFGVFLFVSLPPPYPIYFLFVSLPPPFPVPFFLSACFLFSPFLLRQFMTLFSISFIVV